MASSSKESESDTFLPDPLVSPVPWGYAGEGAPENWARLSDEYRLCGEGVEQSPVDITGYVKGDGPAVSFLYRTDARRVANTESFIRVEYRGESRLQVDGDEYRLDHLHLHHPGEHRIDGGPFALEMHLVHVRTPGEVAVVGVLYRTGAANPAVQAIIDAAPRPNEARDASPALSAAAFLPRTLGYYAYMGSLTTPPCSESVRWMVMSEVGEVSRAQVETMASLTGGGANNRPLQPLGNRSITAVSGRGAAGLRRET